MTSASIGLTEEIKLSGGAFFNEESEEEHVDGEEGAVHTELTDVTADGLQLLLEGSSLNSCL